MRSLFFLRDTGVVRWGWRHSPVFLISFARCYDYCIAHFNVDIRGEDAAEKSSARALERKKYAQRLSFASLFIWFNGGRVSCTTPHTHLPTCCIIMLMPVMEWNAMAAAARTGCLQKLHTTLCLHGECGLHRAAFLFRTRLYDYIFVISSYHYFVSLFLV
jgi:hypothetical protein